VAVGGRARLGYSSSRGMVTGDVRTTVLMLISGRFEVQPAGVSHMLEESRDYAHVGAWCRSHPYRRLTPMKVAAEG